MIDAIYGLDNKPENLLHLLLVGQLSRSMVDFTLEDAEARHKRQDLKPEFLKLLYDAKIEKLNLSTGATNALRYADIDYTGQLVQQQLRKKGSKIFGLRHIPQFGPMCFQETRERLQSIGLDFEMDTGDWEPPK